MGQFSSSPSLVATFWILAECQHSNKWVDEACRTHLGWASFRLVCHWLQLVESGLNINSPTSESTKPVELPSDGPVFVQSVTGCSWVNLGWMLTFQPVSRRILSNSPRVGQFSFSLSFAAIGWILAECQHSKKWVDETCRTPLGRASFRSVCQWLRLVESWLNVSVFHTLQPARMIFATRPKNGGLLGV